LHQISEVMCSRPSVGTGTRPKYPTPGIPRRSDTTNSPRYAQNTFAPAISPTAIHMTRFHRSPNGSSSPPTSALPASAPSPLLPMVGPLLSPPSAPPPPASPPPPFKRAHARCTTHRSPAVIDFEAGVSSGASRRRLREVPLGSATGGRRCAYWIQKSSSVANGATFSTLPPLPFFPAPPGVCGSPPLAALSYQKRQPDSSG